MSDERHPQHPVTVADKHSSFLAKARRLNRTKLFVVDDKAKLSENVKREEFRVLVKKELGGDDDERAVSELREKFEKQQLRTRRKVESHSNRLGTVERNEYKDLAKRAANGGEWSHKHTPLDRTAKDARKLMEYTDHYDDVKMMDRKTMDSRAASIGIIYGQNGKLNIDDQMSSANFSSPLYMGFANSDAEALHKRGDAKEHLGQIGEALGFNTGEVLNPSQHELRDTFDGVFGMSQEEAQQELLSPSLEAPSRKPRYGHDKMSYKEENYETDKDFYNALQPIPQNYTFEHMNKPKLKKHHNSDYDERQSIALAESVINEVRKKYSVTAVRSMYKRRKESEQEDQRSAYNRSKKMMQAGKRAREWKKSRYDNVKGRKTKTIEQVATEEKRKPPPKDDSSDEEEDFFLMDHLTLKEMSTDPFYKSNKEMDCRAQLRAKRKVLLRSNIIENGGYAADTKLCLQMLATTLLRDIDGGIIPRANEVVNEGTATGDWEMWLDPKLDKYAKEAELKTFEVKIPRHNFDDVD
eukprot:CAMPEP_0118639146 /NCGR_PEP_ID=MMETSP0785-20121206/4069_1 /TAXON_ID=91992 /ORGANISM="Bolidomonas pacifica, Strain CCMP 1866" /LENGTH=524 /DNA_ID=CAMNT_0006530457 /DNA_START=116 /DNA_END=1687 /DNA_ORIENTATION=-